MITTDGYAKVLDFGLAKLTEKERSAHSGSTSPQLTQVGTILGTVGYMSPEQIARSISAPTCSRSAASRVRL